MDALKNLATSTVATAPSPATSGTSLVVAAGTGVRYPTAPFDVTLYAPGTRPDPTNAEIARCTAVTTDTLTLTRAQYGTTAQSVAVGWYVDNDVTANLLSQLVPLSTVTTAGDLIVGSGASAVSRLGVGSNGQVLEVVSGSPAWTTPSAGAMTLISSQVLASAAASVTFSSIPGTYNHLKVILIARSSYAAATDGTTIRLNGDSGTNYEVGGLKINNATVTADGGGAASQFFLDSSVNELPAANATVGVALASEITFPGYAGTTFNKKVIAVGGSSNYALSGTSNEGHLLAGMWRNTAAITSITFATFNAANFVAGSAFYLYGIT